jgi:N-acetylmuramoyl-L-alanine amidase
MSKVVLIDNGHGQNTLGKCSPDRRLLEWAYTREIARSVVDKCKSKGIDARLIVTEDWDVSLNERCRRVNAICRQVGAKNVALCSVHVNAAGGDGKWHDARGFCVYVAKNCSDNSKKLARLMYAEATARNLKGNRWVPKEGYWQANFAMVKNTSCPAVLTENLFQDNHEDVDYLLSDEGKQAIADLHVAAIMKYLGQ